MTKKIGIISLLLILIATPLFADKLLDEGFEGTIPPNDWTLVSNSYNTWDSS